MKFKLLSCLMGGWICGLIFPQHAPSDRNAVASSPRMQHATETEPLSRPAVTKSDELDRQSGVAMYPVTDPFCSTALQNMGLSATDVAECLNCIQTSEPAQICRNLRTLLLGFGYNDYMADDVMAYLIGACLKANSPPIDVEIMRKENLAIAILSQAIANPQQFLLELQSSRSSQMDHWQEKAAAFAAAADHNNLHLFLTAAPEEQRQQLVTGILNVCQWQSLEKFSEVFTYLKSLPQKYSLHMMLTESSGMRLAKELDKRGLTIQDALEGGRISDYPVALKTAFIAQSLNEMSWQGLLAMKQGGVSALDQLLQGSKDEDTSLLVGQYFFENVPVLHQLNESQQYCISHDLAEYLRHSGSLEKLQTLELPPEALSGVLEALADDDALPEKWLEMARHLPDKEALWDRIRQVDLKAAWELASSYPLSPTTLADSARRWMEEDPAAALPHIAKASSPEVALAAEKSFRAWAASDSWTASMCLSDLKGTDFYRKGARILAEIIAVDDPAGAEAWLQEAQ